MNGQSVSIWGLLSIGLIVYLGWLMVRPRRTVTASPQSGEYQRLVISHAYLTAIAAHISGLLESTGKVTLGDIDPMPHGYRPMPGEKLLAAMDTVLLEVVPTGRNTAFRSYDNTGHFHREMAEQVIASGKLLITTRALSFRGDMRSHRWYWSKISHVDVLPWSFKVHMHSGKAVTFGFDEPNLEFAKVMITQANL